MKNVKRKKDFNQVCIWPGMTIGDMSKKQFEEIMKEETGFRVQFLEEIITYPDKDDNGNDIPETGGRVDLFFAVHSNDIPKFSLWRLSKGIRWIEDAVDEFNYTSSIYPERVFNYRL